MSGRGDRFRALVRVGSEVSAGRAAEDVMTLVAAEARRLLGATFAVVRVVEGEELVVAALAAEEASVDGFAAVKVGHGLDGKVAVGRAPLRLVEPEEELRQGGGLPPAVAAELRAYLGVPVVAQERVVGTLSVGATLPVGFTEDDVTLLVGLAGHAAVAVERAELTRELLHAQRLSAVGVLVAGVAHELSNPLAAVVGTADILRRQPLDGKLTERLERISMQAQRAGKIVRSLLTLARRTSPEWIEVDLNGLLDDVVELCAFELRHAHVSVVRRFSRDLPPLTADPVQLQQVFTNLCLNACEAMREAHGGGVLTLATRRDPESGRIIVSVTDDGPGIPSQYLGRVFEPFFTTKREGKGTGLGLAISRRIMEDHGGRIGVESRPGTGVTFTVEWPERREIPVAAPRPPERDTQAVGELTVLVVEDDAVVGDLLAEFLAVEGHVVDRAWDGRQALERLRARTYDLIVTDISMPGVDGPAFYRELRQIDPVLARRVVFVTGDAVRAETRAFLDESGLAYLEKPFDRAQFQAFVRRVMRHE